MDSRRSPGAPLGRPPNRTRRSGGPVPLSPRSLRPGSSLDTLRPPSDPSPRRRLGALVSLRKPPTPHVAGSSLLPLPAAPLPAAPLPAAVPGALEAAPPAPQRRPLLPQERSGLPTKLWLHRPGRGPRARAHSGGLGRRRGSAGRSAHTPQPRPRPARLRTVLAPPLPRPNFSPAPP